MGYKLGVYGSRSLCLAATLLGLAACKTTDSGVKSLPVDQIDQLTLDQWTQACQSELNDPVTGAASLNDLQKLANTSDCATAYPVVKEIVDSATNKS